MRISTQGLDFIGKMEGFRSSAYPDPASGGEPWTIGYGTTVMPDGKKVEKGDLISDTYAKICLGDHIYHNVEPVINALASAIGEDFSQSKFDALCSFIYNIGERNFVNSSLYAFLKSGGTDEEAITEDFNKWNKAAGKVMGGLVKRRAAEANLFTTGNYA